MTATKDVTENRHQYIGGSDISAVMGLSRYKTPLRLWQEKTGAVEPADLSDVESVYWGTVLEETVAKEFERRSQALTGKELKVRKAPKVYVGKHPYMVAHIDRLIEGTDELLECKTCSEFKNSEWEEDAIPQEYILQVMWYLGITGRKVGHIACLIGGRKFVYKKIDFDPEFFNAMVEMAERFWEKVKTDTMPDLMPVDVDNLKDMYPEQLNDVWVELYPEDERSAEAMQNLEEQIEKYNENQDLIKNIKSENDLIKAKLEDIIQDNLGIKTAKYQVTWKTSIQNKFDSKVFQAENPDLYEKYIVQKSVRTMRFGKNKDFEVA